MHGLLLAGLLALPLNVLAHPTESHSSGVSRRAIDITSYRLPQISKYTKSDAVPKQDGESFTTSSTGDDNVSSGDYVTTATNWLKKTLPKATYRLVNDHYIGDSGIGHVHFRQTAHGIDIDNTDFNVNVSEIYHCPLSSGIKY